MFQGRFNFYILKDCLNKIKKMEKDLDSFFKCLPIEYDKTANAQKLSGKTINYIRVQST